MERKSIILCLALLLAAVLAMALTGCATQPVEPQTELHLREVGLEGVDAELLSNIEYLDLRDSGTTDLSMLENCTSLQTLDLRGNDITAEQFDKLQNALPECEILWSVPIAGQTYDSLTKKLVLEGENDGTLGNIKYLTDLVYCDLLNVAEVDNAELFAVHEQLPDAQIIWNIAVGRSYVRSDATEFNYSSSHGNDLSALKYCYRLVKADLGNARDGVDFSALAELPTLRTLDLSSAKITDFSAVSAFENLTYLSLSETNFNDLSLLSGLTKLEELYLGKFLERHDFAESLDPISELTSLRKLHVSNAGLKDISAISAMVNIESLALEGNPIEDYSPIANLSNLKTLDLTNTLVSDISFLSGLVNIETLYIGDVDPTLAAAGYSPKSLGKCRVTDFSPIGNLVNIENLIICYTDLEDISFVSSFKKAEVISLHDNKITDPSPLAGLERVEQIELYGNPIPGAAQKELIESMPDTMVYFDNWIDSLF